MHKMLEALSREINMYSYIVKSILSRNKKCIRKMLNAFFHEINIYS